MVIKIEKEVNTWYGTLNFLMNNIDLARKGHSGYYFKNVVIDQFNLVEDPFKTCCYTNPRGKLSTLRKQYLNEESLKDVFSSNKVEVSMIGGPKWGSTAGNKHCMERLEVDHNNKHVTIYFRNSDFLKKFLVDIYFVKEILSEVGIGGYTYSCVFENLTLRSPFVYLFLNEVEKYEGEEKVKEYLDSDNVLIRSFLEHYKKLEGKDISYKSLERCRRRMKASPLYVSIIRRYIEDEYHRDKEKD